MRNLRFCSSSVSSGGADIANTKKCYRLYVLHFKRVPLKSSQQISISLSCLATFAGHTLQKNSKHRMIWRFLTIATDCRTKPKFSLRNSRKKYNKTHMVGVSYVMQSLFKSLMLVTYSHNAKHFVKKMYIS
jgi:hypothetical protein